MFRGAGWNVIKIIWGSGWDKLLAKDKSGLLLQRMEECVDGEYQDFKSKSGAYVREHFFGKYEELKALVADMSDDEIWGLTRGGHDPVKVFAAYAAAVKHMGQPTVLLPKTVKGYGMGESGEGQMIAHQAKKMTQDALRNFRDRFQIPVPDEQLVGRAVHQAAGRQPRDEVPARAARGAGRLPAAAPAQVGSAEDPAAGDVRAPAQEHRRARDLAPPWPSCRCSAPSCATRTSASTSCRSCRTNRAPSAWKACSASSASTRRSASSTSRRTPTS